MPFERPFNPVPFALVSLGGHVLPMQRPSQLSAALVMRQAWPLGGHPERPGHRLLLPMEAGQRLSKLRLPVCLSEFVFQLILQLLCCTPTTVVKEVIYCGMHRRNSAVRLCKTHVPQTLVRRRHVGRFLRCARQDRRHGRAECYPHVEGWAGELGLRCCISHGELQASCSSETNTPAKVKGGWGTFASPMCAAPNVSGL